MNEKVRPNEVVPASEQSHDQESGSYEAPALFPIGDARELLRGSGRHKNDDTGKRGFEVG